MTTPLSPARRRQFFLEARELAVTMDDLERRLRAVETQSQLARSSIEDGALTVVEDGQTTVVIGAQYDGTSGAVTVVSPQPPRPWIPAVEPVIGGLLVRWDGYFTDENGNLDPVVVAPMDFKQVDVVVSTAATPDWLATPPSHSFVSPRGGEVFLTLPPTPHKVVLVARAAAGTASAPSAVVTATPLPSASVEQIEADVAAIYDAVAAGDTANAQQIDAAVLEFQQGLATKSTHTLSPDPPGTSPNNAGDVWEQHKAGDPTSIIGRWRGKGGTSWSPMNLDATYIPLLDIGSGTFGDLDGNRLTANSIGVETLLVASLANLLNDPEFLRPLGETWQTQRWASISSGAGRASDRAALRVNDDAAGGQEFVYNLPLDHIVCEPGDSFRVNSFVQVRGTGTAPADGVRIGVRWRRADGTYAWSYVANRASVAPSLTWRSVADLDTTTKGIVTAPADTVSMSVFVAKNYESPGAFVMFTEPSVSRAANGKLIVDGSVQARHFTGDTFEGAIMRGALFETHEGQRGIKIVSNADPADGGDYGSMIAYDSAGVPTFTLNGQTGVAYLTGGLLTAAPGGYPYVNQDVISNVFESGQNWAMTQYGVAAGWAPGQLWGAYFPNTDGSSGRLRLSAPYPTNRPSTDAAFVDMWTSLSGASSMRLRSDEMQITAESWRIGSLGSPVDFHLSATDYFQIWSRFDAQRLAIVFRQQGGKNAIEIRARDAVGTGAYQNLEIGGKKIFFDPSDAHRLWIGRHNGTNARPVLAREDNQSALALMENELRAQTVGDNLIPIRASSFPTGSDEALKEDIQPIGGDPWDPIRRLSASDYTLKATGKRGRGFVAQRVREVLPMAVVGEEGDLAVDPYPLLATLWTAMQGAVERLDAIELLPGIVDRLTRDVDQIKKGNKP